MTSLLLRLLVLSLLWWLITEGAGGWAVGTPVILLALGASYWLQPEPRVRLRPAGLLRFAGFFLVQSLRAGLDVALRAFRPSMPLYPALQEYRLRLALLAHTHGALPSIS